MAIGYTWDVSTVDTYPTKDSKSDVIFTVHWRLTATDDTNKDSDGNFLSSNTYSTQTLDTSDLSSFKDFGSVSVSDVQGWVESAIGTTRINELKAMLDAQIAAKITPTSVQKTIGS